MRGRIRRLERLAHGDQIEIPQQDGTIRTFTPAALPEAFQTHMQRLGAGEDAPPEHPLIEAARNSSDPKWSESFFATEAEGWTEPVENLSEGREDPV